jgi:Mg-chelatase subunit ChlD
MQRLLNTLACGFILAIPPWTASTAAVDVALALDRSGSMKASDPRRDSVQGVELFAQLLGSEDRLAFLSFADEAETSLPMTPLAEPGARAKLAELARQVKMNGAHTNLAAALSQSYQALSSPAGNPKAERVVVLFTDGKLDLGSPEAEAAARASVAELLPKLKAEGIRVYGVAFSPGADLGFLSSMAEATGGQAFRVEQPKDIYQAFIRLFEEADQPLSAPIVDSRVAVDANAQELKLLVGRDSPTEAIHLTDPAGRQIDESNLPPGVEWTRAPQFNRITVKQPQAGSWEVAGAHGEKKAYLASDLSLAAKLPPLVQAGQAVEVSARLTYQGRTVSDPSMLQGVKFTATMLNGVVTPAQPVALQMPTDPGSVAEPRGSLNFPGPGNYRVRFSAESASFVRAKELSTTVTAAPAAAAPAPAPEPAAKAPPEPEPKPPAAPPEPAPPPQPPVAAESEDNRHDALSRLIWLNAGIFGLVGAFVLAWWWKSHRQPKQADVEAEEAEPDSRPERPGRNTRPSGRSGA